MASRTTKASVSILFSLFLIACAREYQPNPDPNHTHADFAVYVDGEQIRFSGQEHMSTEEDHKHDYLHLHDGLGHVIHRHKPGLTLGEFLDSLEVELPTEGLHMYVNGVEIVLDLAYVFSDMDQILLTTDRDEGTVQYQLKTMTADACLYSRTCPWRGEPSVENCVADPLVPCVAPE